MDWKCTINNCGKDADYSCKPNYYCVDHWIEFLHKSEQISDEIYQRTRFKGEEIDKT